MNKSKQCNFYDKNRSELFCKLSKLFVFSCILSLGFMIIIFILERFNLINPLEVSGIFNLTLGENLILIGILVVLGFFLLVTTIWLIRFKRNCKK